MLKSKKFLSSLAGASLLLAVQAQAAIPAAFITAIGDLEDDAATIATTVVPVVVAFVAIGIGIKLFKKYSNKAS